MGSSLVPLGVSAVLIVLLVTWNRKSRKFALGDVVFYAVLILVLVGLIWLKLGG